jgi:putative addiction module CopG family antidote
VTVNPQLEDFIQTQVRSGRFHNPSEVIQAGLEVLQRELDLAAAFDIELEKGFEDFEAGRFQTFDSVAQLKSEIESRVQARD